MADDFRGDIHTEGKVAVNGSIDGRIDAAGDHDWFRVFLRAGVKYRFDTLVTSSSSFILAPFMRLFDSNGQYSGLLNGGANESLNPEFFFQPTVSGIYYVDVEQLDAVQITGTYTLSVATDDFAAGTSTIAEVKPDAPAVSATVETIGDHDWFKVSLSGAHHFVLRESGASTGAGTLQDPLLTLYGFPQTNFIGDAHTVKLTQDDDSGPGRDARIDLTTAGRFSSFYLDAGSADGGTGTYTVSVTTADALVGPSHVLWRNDAGRLVDWNINDGVIASSADLTFNSAAVRPDSAWSVAEVADFNGDFNADLLWRNTNGALIEWTMQRSTIASSAELMLNGSAVRPDASWSVAGAGDFNGDGKADLLWRNANGELVSWMMDGSAISASADVRSGGAAARPDASWSVAGIGDFNGDGKADVLWRNANGTLSEWQMNGTAIAASGFITLQGAVVAPDTSWHIIQIGDFNGDAQSDILWRNDSGVVTEWQMKGSQIIGTTVPAAGGLDGSWHDQIKPTNLG